MFIRQAARAWTLYLAASGERIGVVDASAAIDADERHRLAATGAHTYSRAVGIKKMVRASELHQ